MRYRLYVWGPLSRCWQPAGVWGEPGLKKERAAYQKVGVCTAWVKR
jgi:hypothetical protein